MDITFIDIHLVHQSAILNIYRKRAGNLRPATLNIASNSETVTEWLNGLGKPSKTIDRRPSDQPSLPVAGVHGVWALSHCKRPERNFKIPSKFLGSDVILKNQKYKYVKVVAPTLK